MSGHFFDDLNMQRCQLVQFLKRASSILPQMKDSPQQGQEN